MTLPSRDLWGASGPHSTSPLDCASVAPVVTDMNQALITSPSARQIRVHLTAVALSYVLLLTAFDADKGQTFPSGG